MSPDQYLFLGRKISRSSVKHEWNHRTISSGMTLFYDEHWAYLQYGTNWFPFAEHIHACAWFTASEKFSRHIFSLAVWFINVGILSKTCPWYLRLESSGDIPRLLMRHFSLSCGGGEERNKGKIKISPIQWFLFKLLGLGLMCWAAVSECRNAEALRVHRGTSEPEEKDNRQIILTVTEAFGEISNWSE